jgi:hypothetical protein
LGSTRGGRVDHKVTRMTAPLLQSDETGNRAPRTGRRRSYEEGVDESAKLIDDEAVEVERESPAEENDPVERPGLEDAGPPAFEDDEPSR